MKVRDVMTATPICSAPDTPIPEIARLMAEHDCGGIPIVDGAATRPVGFVTDRDIAVRIVAKGLNALAMVARDCMSTPVVTVSPDDSVEDCCQTMETHQIRRVAVVDEKGACVGIVSQADVALKVSDVKVAEVLKEVSRNGVLAD
jgi:CBS domain-containing protein